MYPIVGFKMRMSKKAGEVPSLSTLHWDELAYNIADGKLYAKKVVDGVDVIVDLTASGTIPTHPRLHSIISALDHGAADPSDYDKIVHTNKTTGAIEFIDTPDVEEFPIDIQRFGFLNQTETTISFDGTKVFTLAPVGTSWSYYRSGLKHTITGSKTVDLTTVESPLIDGRTYFIYIDSETGDLIGDIATWTLRDTKVPVSTILWNNTLTPKYILAEERHSCLIDRRMHFYEHFTNGAKAITLGALSGWTANTDTNAAKTFSIADSVIADEDILNLLGALADPNGTNTDYFVMYRSGSSWVWKASNMPFVYNVGNTNNQIQYDNAGTMTDSTGGGGANTRYLNSYLLMTNFKGSARFLITPGRAQFTTLALAQAENPSTFVWTGFPVQEALIAYQITWSTVTSTSQGKCVLVAVKNISLSAIATIGLGNTIDHETLANLQGGLPGQHNHLSDAELIKAVGDSYPLGALNYRGETATFTAGENLSFGDLCYIADNGTLKKGNATSVITSYAMAICLATIVSGNSGLFLLSGGFIYNAAWNFNLGEPLYLGLLDGGYTQVLPDETGYIVQLIGIPVTATILHFTPSLSQVEIGEGAGGVQSDKVYAMISLGI